MSAETDRWDAWLAAIQTDGLNLTPWEDDFVESLVQQREAGRRLTERQAEILERIYTDRTP